MRADQNVDFSLLQLFSTKCAIFSFDATGKQGCAFSPASSHKRRNGVKNAVWPEFSSGAMMAA